MKNALFIAVLSSFFQFLFCVYNHNHIINNNNGDKYSYLNYYPEVLRLNPICRQLYEDNFIQKDTVVSLKFIPSDTSVYFIKNNMKITENLEDMVSIIDILTKCGNGQPRPYGTFPTQNIIKANSIYIDASNVIDSLALSKVYICLLRQGKGKIEYVCNKKEITKIAILARNKIAGNFLDCGYGVFTLKGDRIFELKEKTRMPRE